MTVAKPATASKPANSFRIDVPFLKCRHLSSAVSAETMVTDRERFVAAVDETRPARTFPLSPTRHEATS
jgi:hypothetical protein